MKRYRVLFVCLGNICRSPTAHGVFRELVCERGLEKQIEFDSCGTGAWHIGDPPHPDTQRVARDNGIDISDLRARKIRSIDFDEFDLIVAMDSQNYRDIRRHAPREKLSQIIRLREYDHEEDLDVPDPYYGPGDGFERVFEIVHRCCAKLLDEIEEELRS